MLMDQMVNSKKLSGRRTNIDTNNLYKSSLGLSEGGMEIGIPNDIRSHDEIGWHHGRKRRASAMISAPVSLIA